MWTILFLVIHNYRYIIYCFSLNTKPKFTIITNSVVWLLQSPTTKGVNLYILWLFTFIGRCMMGHWRIREYKANIASSRFSSKMRQYTSLPHESYRVLRLVVNNDKKNQFSQWSLSWSVPGTELRSHCSDIQYCKIWHWYWKWYNKNANALLLAIMGYSKDP